MTYPLKLLALGIQALALTLIAMLTAGSVQAMQAALAPDTGSIAVWGLFGFLLALLYELMSLIPRTLVSIWRLDRVMYLLPSLSAFFSFRAAATQEEQVAALIASAVLALGYALGVAAVFGVRLLRNATVRRSG